MVLSSMKSLGFCGEKGVEIRRAVYRGFLVMEFESENCKIDEPDVLRKE